MEMRLLFFLVLLATTLINCIVKCVVDLHPRGVEYICPGDNVSRTLTCSVSAPYMQWNVRSGIASVETIQFVQSNAIGETLSLIGLGVVATLISSTSNSLLTRLTTSDRPELLPLTVHCHAIGDTASDFYSVECKEQPDPPTNITLIKSEDMATTYTIRWLSSSSGSRSADNYTVNITDSSSLSQTFTTSTTTLTMDLSHNTNYTISVKATNCVGDSGESTISIVTDEEPTTSSPATTSGISSTLLKFSMFTHENTGHLQPSPQQFTFENNLSESATFSSAKTTIFIISIITSIILAYVL